MIEKFSNENRVIGIKVHNVEIKEKIARLKKFTIIKIIPRLQSFDHESIAVSYTVQHINTSKHNYVAIWSNIDLLIYHCAKIFRFV